MWGRIIWYMTKLCYLLMNRFSHNLSPVKWSSSSFTSRPLKWIWRTHTKMPKYRESTISNIHSNSPLDPLISILAILILDSIYFSWYSWTESGPCYLDPSTGTVNKRSGPRNPHSLEQFPCFSHHGKRSKTTPTPHWCAEINWGNR